MDLAVFRLSMVVNPFILARGALVVWLAVFQVAPLLGEDLPEASQEVKTSSALQRCGSMLSWLGNVRRIKRLDGQSTQDAIALVSGQEGQAKLTLESAFQMIETWATEYEAYSAEKAKFSLAETIVQDRISKMEHLLRLVQQGHIHLPSRLTGIQPSPIISEGKLTLLDENSSLPVALSFERERALQKALLRERKLLGELQQMKADESLSQAFRYWKLDQFLKAFSAGSDEASVATNLTTTASRRLELHRRISRLLDRGNASSRMLRPKESDLVLVEKAAAIDRNTVHLVVRQLMRGTASGARAFAAMVKRWHTRIDGAGIPLKMIANSGFILAGVGALIVGVSNFGHQGYVWLTHDEQQIVELQRNEKLKQEIFEIAGTSPDFRTFFNKFYAYAIREYPDESIQIALEYMTGRRANLTPDGTYAPSYFKTASEIVDFFNALVDGKKDDTGNTVVMGAGGRMARREWNADAIRELRDLAEVKGLKGIVAEFGKPRPPQPATSPTDPRTRPATTRP